MDFAGDPAVEAKLVAGAEREAGLVFVAGDVVGLDRVEALAPAEVEAVAEDRRQQVDAADVEPALVGIAFVDAAEDRLWESGPRRGGSSPRSRRRGNRSPCGPGGAAWRRSWRRLRSRRPRRRRLRSRCRSSPAAATARRRWSVSAASGRRRRGRRGGRRRRATRAEWRRGGAWSRTATVDDPRLVAGDLLEPCGGGKEASVGSLGSRMKLWITNWFAGATK